MKNIYKRLTTAQTLAAAPDLAARHNQTWYIIGDTGMIANDKGRKGYEQYRALAYHPNGDIEVIEASPRG